MRTHLQVSLLALAALVGCQASPGSSGPPTAAVQRFDAGFSSEGRPIEVLAFGEGREVVLMLASIHGSEPAGTALLERLAGALVAQPELLRGRRVVLVPRANPDGLILGTRGNAAAVDLNRDFPSRNRALQRAEVQPETRALMDLIEGLEPARIVSIHQPLGCIDWDGPADELVRALGALQILSPRRLGSRPGSLGSWAGVDRRIPVVTLELPGGSERQSSDQLWQRYGKLVLEAVAYRPRL